MNVPAPEPRWWLGGLLLWLLTVSWLLFTPAPELASAAPYTDKLGHLGIFAIAGVWIAWRAPRWSQAWPWLLALIGFAVLSELIQHQLPTRSAEWADGLADSLGLTLGFECARRVLSTSVRAS